MSEETPDESTPESEPIQPTGPVFLVSYPKIVFLYPTVIAAIFGTIFMYFGGYTAEDPGAAIPGRIFLTVLMINLVVVSFDFPRTTSLTWFFAIVAVCIGLWMLFTFQPDLLAGVSRVLNQIHPSADAHFYLIYAAGMIGLFICVIISRRFDYWEVRGNELLHHHGFLSDMERFAAPNLRIDKEINDVFEYLLLRSGRLILHPSQERRAIVLENVFFINQKEEKITKMLGALQVRLRPDGH